MSGLARSSSVNVVPSAPLRWIMAARLKTVGLSLTPVMCGTWIAAQHLTIRPGLAFLTALSATAIQVGTNFWNDAADAARGTDTAERLGPARMTALGLLDAASVKRAAVISFAVALLAGLPLVLVGGVPVIVIGVVSLVLGYAYSVGPWPLSHTPLGELIVIVFFGVVAVAGTVHVLGAHVTGQSLLAGLMMGLPSSAVLLLNNHRDRKADTGAGRRTLAILVGEQSARMLYGGLLAGTVVLFLLLTGGSPMTLLLALAATIASMLLSAAVWRTPVSAALNRFLPLTVLFQLALLLALVLSDVLE